jgi:outer membrane autotransporter protein
MTNVVGSRVIGFINLVGTPGIQDTVNFVGGNWLFTFNTLAQATIITHGAPFVVVNNGNGSSTVAVLDPTVFALTDRALMNFTGDVAQMLQGRFDGMPVAGAGRAAAMSFAPAASGSALTDEVQAAFSGIPSVAMSYASDARRPLIGKASPAGEPYYDTTIWASGFGGERKQRVDGSVLPATDTAYGGALGIDRAFGPNLRLGGFLGGGASRESVELSVQSVDATYIFGGVYGRFDWVAQYLDFALYGGSIKISNSTIGFADNLVPTGFVNATAANSGGWFISPELTYGYRIPFNAVTVTPRVRLRYLGASLDGLNESFAGQNLSVARRAINDLEERGEVEVSTVSGAFKGTASIGVIGLERLGNPIVNTVLLTQNLSFATPGQNNAVGGVFGLGLQYQPLPNVKLFVAGEGTAMSDKSDSFAASGGAQLSF